MSKQSEKIAAIKQRHRQRYGEDIILRGVVYRCRTVEATGAKAGETAIPRGVYGIYIAASVPRLFDFSPADFAPTTNILPPIEGEEVTRNALIYVLATVDYENVDTDTVSIYCYGLRKIWNIPPPSF